jgi:hypothetical protein
MEALHSYWQPSPISFSLCTGLLQQVFDRIVEFLQFWFWSVSWNFDWLLNSQLLLAVPSFSPFTSTWSNPTLKVEVSHWWHKRRGWGVFFGRDIRRRSLFLLSDHCANSAKNWPWLAARWRCKSIFSSLLTSEWTLRTPLPISPSLSEKRFSRMNLLNECQFRNAFLPEWDAWPFLLVLWF